MPRVFDCILLEHQDQLPLLECRMREYRDIPEVIHVICEAKATYQGEPKDVHFTGFPRGKWNHVLAETHELPQGEPRERKNALREYLLHGFTGEPDDIILHGSIDEIPAEWVVRRLAAGQSPLPVVIQMRHCVYTARQLHPAPWYGSAAMARKDVTTLTGLRDGRKNLPVIVTAGTRLSLMGGEGACHPDGSTLRESLPDDTWPKWVTGGNCPRNWL